MLFMRPLSMDVLCTSVASNTCMSKSTNLQNEGRTECLFLLFKWFQTSPHPPRGQQPAVLLPSGDGTCGAAALAQRALD